MDRRVLQAWEVSMIEGSVELICKVHEQGVHPKGYQRCYNEENLRRNFTAQLTTNHQLVVDRAVSYVTSQFFFILVLLMYPSNGNPGGTLEAKEARGSGHGNDVRRWGVQIDVRVRDDDIRSIP